MSTIFDQIVIKIIKEQELVIGPLAWAEAGKVSGIHIVDSKSGNISLESTDAKSIIDRLVSQYERLFGRASREVCKEAAIPFLKELPASEIPSSLK